MTRGVPRGALIATVAFGPALKAERVAAAIDEGLRAAGMVPADLCPLDPAGGGDVHGRLQAIGFDARMRRARAVILGCERLSEDTLAGSVAFEIASRARQAGVPAYAVARESSLNAFDARILDLGEVLIARDRRALVAAGQRLAAFL